MGANICWETPDQEIFINVNPYHYVTDVGPIDIYSGEYRKPTLLKRVYHKLSNIDRKMTPFAGNPQYEEIKKEFLREMKNPDHTLEETEFELDTDEFRSWQTQFQKYLNTHCKQLDRSSPHFRAQLDKMQDYICQWSNSSTKSVELDKVFGYPQ